MHLPGMEERRPIDIAFDLLQGKMLEHPDAQETGDRRRIAVPVDLGFVGTRLFESQPLGMGAAPGMLFAYLRVLTADLRHESLPRFVTDQVLRHTHGA